MKNRIIIEIESDKKFTDEEYNIVLKDLVYCIETGAINRTILGPEILRNTKLSCYRED